MPGQLADDAFSRWLLPPSLGLAVPHDKVTVSQHTRRSEGV
ncbi:uncharacterized protein METZ01_LOCUS440612 [marine metagenome]|uniref:Uncharacterized protein n=1 Tax=marine metagenome TaxID=408172 RepID=A0A382YZ25_9ZZZZ